MIHKFFRITIVLGIVLCSNDCLSQNDSHLEKSIEQMHSFSANRMDDSLLLSALKFKDDISSINSCEYSAQAYYFLGTAYNRLNPQLAIKMLDTAVVFLAECKPLDEIWINIFNGMGNSLSNIGDHPKAIEYYIKSINAIERQDDQNKYAKKLAGINYNLALTYVRIGNATKSFYHLENTMRIGTELNDSILLMASNYQRANIELVRQNYEEAAKYFEVAIKYGVDSSNYPYMLQGLATAHFKTGKLKKAFAELSESISLFEMAGDVIGLSGSKYNQASFLLESNDLESCEKVCYELLDLANQVNIERYKLSANTILCECDFEKKQYQNGVRRLESIKNLIERNSELDAAQFYFECLYKNYKALGKNKKALYAFEQLQVYKDSILNIESVNKEQEYNAKFENFRQEKEIESLQSEKTLDSLIYRNRILKLIAIFSGFVLLALIYLFFLKRKQTQMRRQRIEIEQKLLRSQLNPHFIFNALSSIQNYLFNEKDFDIALNYMANLTSLMRQILENSREEYITLEEEILTITNYIKLQQLRFHDKFNFSLKVDEQIDVRDILVPPLITQPFVENAIEHGMKYIKHDGLIDIEFKINRDLLIVKIKDNGVGFDSNSVKEKRIFKKKSVSTQIIKERLNLISSQHKRKFEYVLDSRSDFGTSVTINLPLIRS